ncbi:unnamed protein product [Heligmosomoides polygyrus]|uniref:Phlebovirus_G2 domain-containing protein n=1 Tax=Heligmosomoides polygyrus TaxID=6339 RepID=A0A183GMS1_HELPZ|nr:unnamed protein product [Heligmosomoides polygyrus]
MITRSRTSLNFNILTTIVSTLLLIQLNLALNTRCPNGFTLNKTILYATNCAKQGIAIARYTELKEERLCWYPVSCPLGAIRSDFPFNNSSPLCGQPCHCPKWATSCSFSDGSSTTLSELSLVPEGLRNFKPNYVCSFNHSTKCDQEQQIGNFHQVQLFDGSLLIVENLSLSFKDFLDEYDFTCVDRKGWRRRPHDSITGTSGFCKKHQCKARATLFCTYDNPLTLLVINDTESSTSIPIQAWGTISKAFYGFPRKPRATGGHINSDRSIVKTTCSTGGISLQSDNSLDVAEVCINNYCIFLKNVTSETLLFPNSLVMYDYEASIKLWKNGNISNDDKLACKAQPICELLHCHACWERLYNRKCWTYSDIILLMFGIAAVVIILPTAYIVVKIILTTLSFITTVFGNFNPIRSGNYTSTYNFHYNEKMKPPPPTSDYYPDTP